MRARLGHAAGLMLLVVPLVVAAAVLALVIGGDGDSPESPTPATVGAVEPTFTSLDELIAASDAVVLGEIASVEDGRAISDPSDAAAGIRTQLASVQVVEVLAGEVSDTGDGDQIVIEQEAALLDGTPIEVNGVSALKEGEQGIYFLLAGRSEEFPYFALVNRQGRFDILGDTLVAASDDPLSGRLAAMTPSALRCAIDGC